MTQRRLSRDYAQWERHGEDLVARAVTTGLIVLDTNVLLSLYEVASSSREEVLRLFERVEDRLWIPHQVALEYSRNRKRVVIDRARRFSRARSGLGAASAKAAAALTEAVTAIAQLNEGARSSQPWSPQGAGLDKASIDTTITDLLEPARAELDRLHNEHDITPSDVEAHDPVFERVDALLAGRIGEPIDHRTRRELVDDARHYRYPNRIPPGDGDADKATDVDAAGDYLLWWETLRKAGEDAAPDHIVLVTADAKSDWWVLNDSGKPLHPRPELAQELHDQTGRQLVVLSSQEFAAVANTHLGAGLSPRAVADIEHAAEAVTDLAPTGLSRLATLGVIKERVLARELAAAVRRLGLLYHDNPGGQFDGAISAEPFGLPDWVTVEVKGSGRRLGTTEVFGFYADLVDRDPADSLFGPDKLAQRAVLVAPGGFIRNGGPLQEDDRLYLLGPEELSLLLNGATATPFLDWLLRDAPGLIELGDR